MSGRPGVPVQAGDEDHGGGAGRMSGEPGVPAHERDADHGTGSGRMSGRPAHVMPYRFDLPALMLRSVATLYNKHLVTRPTGQALRRGIESQLTELGALCLSVLDFTQVVVLDYSCADETVAKLLQRYLPDRRPVDAYFIARGVGDHHRETLEAVLVRHGLVLVAELNGRGAALLGESSPLEHAAWSALERRQAASAEELCDEIGGARHAVDTTLEALARRRVVLAQGDGRVYYSLSALLDPDGV